MVGGSSGQNPMSLPANVTWANFTYTILAGAKPSVYQALATRAGGEVISSDSY